MDLKPLEGSVLLDHVPLLAAGVSSRPIWGDVGKGCPMGGPRKRECNNHADLIATNLCPDPECTYVPLPDGPAKMEGKVKPDRYGEEGTMQ